MNTPVKHAKSTALGNKSVYAPMVTDRDGVRNLQRLGGRGGGGGGSLNDAQC